MIMKILSIIIFLQFIRAIGGEGPEERQIRQEVLRLKQQLQNISMVDQFASYARIQRKINSLNQQYKAKGALSNILLLLFSRMISINGYICMCVCVCVCVCVCM